LIRVVKTPDLIERSFADAPFRSAAVLPRLFAATPFAATSFAGAPRRALWQQCHGPKIF
jgi:hypothetical protein